MERKRSEHQCTSALASYVIISVLCLACIGAAEIGINAVDKIFGAGFVPKFVSIDQVPVFDGILMPMNGSFPPYSLFRWIGLMRNCAGPLTDWFADGHAKESAHISKAISSNVRSFLQLAHIDLSEFVSGCMDSPSKTAAIVKDIRIKFHPDKNRDSRAVDVLFELDRIERNLAEQCSRVNRVQHSVLLGLCRYWWFPCSFV